MPRSAVLGLALHALRPRTSERLLLDALRKYHISDERKPVTAGNLYEPPDEPARTHAERPPKVSTARFAAWATARFVQIELEFAKVRMQRWLAKRRREVLLPA